MPKYSMSAMSEYVDKYVSLVMEYFQLCSNSEAIKTSEISNFIIGSGLIAMDHIFALAYSITNDLEATAKYVNRGNSYFHEYLDQLNRTGMIQSVDCTDIIKFVYSKTVCEIYDGNGSGLIQRNDLSKHYISPSVVGTILWCSNPGITCLQRHEITYMYLLPILEYMYCPTNQEGTVSDILKSIEELLCIVSDLQEWNPRMKSEDYFALLIAVHKYIKKLVKDGICVDILKDKRVYMITNWKNLTLEEIVRMEGYKNIGDLILR